MGQFDPGMPRYQRVIKLQTHRAPACTTDTTAAVSDVNGTLLGGTPIMVAALVINPTLFDALLLAREFGTTKKCASQCYLKCLWTAQLSID